ncbi:MAG: nucleotidyltransferase family protein [Kangiellaceae bacterium]|nr:nucleotidyltransferase family protein [Kangiellaceae bacterium]MCW8998270.1 nucleotidyltransferase family protein [Kangiellaceae bacterium]
MILAAGKGERMMPLTAKTPKPMLEVAGKPLMEYHLEKFIAAGINQLVINHSHLGEQIEIYFSTGKKWGVEISWSREETPLETAGGIIKALPLLGDDPFIIINGDVWCDIDISTLTEGGALKKLKTGENLAHLVLVENPLQNPGGDFGLENHQIVNQSDKMFTYAGISIIHPKLFNVQLADQKLGLAPLLREAANKNQVSGEVYYGEWQDIGTPERLHELRKSQDNN